MRIGISGISTEHREVLAGKVAKDLNWPVINGAINQWMERQSTGFMQMVKMPMDVYVAAQQCLLFRNIDDEPKPINFVANGTQFDTITYMFCHYIYEKANDNIIDEETHKQMMKYIKSAVSYSSHIFNVIYCLPVLKYNEIYQEKLALLLQKLFLNTGISIHNISSLEIHDQVDEILWHLSEHHSQALAAIFGEG